jgi:N-acetyl-anhydromuramyl-L-alanine amidase AmpD
MVKSPLTNVTIPAHSTNYSKGRAGYKVTKITPHHVAGNLSVEAMGAMFQASSRNASSNYGIGSDGRIACYVGEENRAWTSSSAINDNQSITIEVANSGGAPSWPVNEKAFAALVDLCVDICQRYGISKLTYTGTSGGSLTRHNFFAAT